MSLFLSFIPSISTSVMFMPKNSFAPVYGIGAISQPGFAALIFFQSSFFVIVNLQCGTCIGSGSSALPSSSALPDSLDILSLTTNSPKSGMNVV